VLAGLVFVVEKCPQWQTPTSCSNEFNANCCKQDAVTDAAHLRLFVLPDLHTRNSGTAQSGNSSNGHVSKGRDI